MPFLLRSDSGLVFSSGNVVKGAKRQGSRELGLSICTRIGLTRGVLIIVTKCPGDLDWTFRMRLGRRSCKF